ncbi:glycosyltransferase family 8 protein [Catenovulum sp. SX2]|uniref:glycosyltransferase family 8 protein n=1 Tax=Catenovulum sp. SX2 TaxID=3398614 RepID=UPI003F84694B
MAEFNFVFCIDERFVEPLGVLLTSIEANRARSFVPHYHVIYQGLSGEKKLLLKKSLSSDALISFYSYTSSHIGCLNVSDEFKNRLSVATYFRFELASILPEYIDKILYLDADMLVLTDLAKIFALDFTDGELAAVVEDALVSNSMYAKNLVDGARYFNAGMMMIDMARWRASNITQHLWAAYEQHPNVKFNDQDILNVVLKNRVKIIANGWNLQTQYLVNSAPNAIGSTQDVEHKIIHYTGAEKPWHFTCDHPYTKHYLKYRALSEFSFQPLQLYLDEHDKKLLSRLTKLPSNCGVVIYACGVKGRRISSYISQYLPYLEISQMVDKKVSGSNWLGKTIEATLKNDRDWIIVCSEKFAREIYNELVEQGIKPDSIIYQE